MNVIISNYPENLKVPAEYVENVTAAAEKVGELYGVENGEVSITLTDNATSMNSIGNIAASTARRMSFPLPSMKVRSRRSRAARISMSSAIS